MIDDNILDALLTAFSLKDVKRTGWILREVENPESAADHSWGTALLTLLFGDGEKVDLGRCLSMAAAHDLPESVTGDFAARVDPDEQLISRENKRKAEETAMELIASGLKEQGGEIRALWQEYEEAETREARFVRDMNLIDMCLQALKYEWEGRYSESADNPNFQHFKGMDEFFATSGPRISTATGKALYDDIHTAYKKLRSPS